MISYAAVDRKENNFLICEVELISTEERNGIKFLDDDKTQMMEIDIQQISEFILPIREGDILVVEHDGLVLISVLAKDIKEKQRRIDILKALY